MKRIYSEDTKDGRIVFYIIDHGKCVTINQAQADYLIEKGLAKYFPNKERAME